jgi:hypothetical protein
MATRTALPSTAAAATLNPHSAEPDQLRAERITYGRIRRVPFSNEFLDRYVAPGFSSFSEATIPDMTNVSKEQGHGLGNFILNSCFRVSMEDELRPTIFNFLRRAEAAFREYEEARKYTLAYLSEPCPNSVSAYFRSIGHWEQFLSQADRAWAVLVRGEKFLDVKNDGSVVQRLSLLYNCTKLAV